VPFGPRIFFTASTSDILAVDLDDLVPGPDAGAVGGRVLDGRHDGEHAVPQGDLDAETAEAALRVDLQLLVEIGREVGAVRVERGQHPVDGALDELIGGDVLDVVLLDDREDVGEGLEVLVARVLADRVHSLDGSTTEERHDERGHKDQ
jgi:hypothetical protein